MLLSSKTQNALLWILAIILLCFISWYFRQTTTALQKKIDTANETIAIMKLEHEAARIAANDAKIGREEVYEMAKEKLCKAETAINGNSVFCDMVIPDDFKLLWKKPGHTATDHIQPAK